MKVPTYKLNGVALDWMITQLEEPKICFSHFLSMHGHYAYDTGTFDYSTCWKLGGPIIERERISIRPDVASPDFRAFVIRSPNGLSHRHIGPTPLIAAMRCYVASELGEEVNIPDKLASFIDP